MPSFRKLCYMLILLLLPVASQHLFAQTTSQVSGVVTDATGAVVASATVQITDTDTGAVRTTTTNDKGAYTFPDLAIGPYMLQVSKAGFTKYVQTGIVLELNTNPSIMVSLKPGSVTEEVDVTANAVQVETQDPAVNQVIDPHEVVDLPLNGREVTDLIALSGASINTNGAGGAINTLDYPTAVSYSVAGSQPNSTNYNLDGAQHLDYRTNVGLPMPFPDALSEFSVGISAMPANLGIRPGGMVNASTKSGTNSFHGNVFEFVRNGFFDATGYVFPTSRGGKITPGSKDTLQRNQFGGTIGGPIKKDKIFFFGGYQGTMNNSTTGKLSTQLPDSHMQTGDFSYLAGTQGQVNSFGCTAEPINSAYLGTYTGAAGNSNVLNPALLTATGGAAPQNQAVNKAVEALYANPQAGLGFYDNCGDFHYNALPLYTFETQGVARVDWNRTKNDTIFGSYFLSKYSEPSYYSKGDILSNNGIGDADQIQTVAIGDTRVAGTHSVNTIRLSFDRTATQRTSNTGIPTVCQLGVTASCPNPNNEDLLFGVKPGFEGWDMENSYGVTEGWAWTNGAHQLNIGFSFIHVQMNGDGTYQEDPEMGFTSSPVTSFALSDFVIGNLDSILQGGGQISRDGQNQPSAYIQDSWKVSPRLQLTYGLRWDPFFAQHNKYGMNSDFNLANYVANTGFSQIFPNMPPGTSFPGDQGFRGTSDTNNQTKTFAPRIGFVWNLTSRGNMTLRGGYGIFYDTSTLWNTMHVVLNPPWGATVSFTPQPAFTFPTPGNPQPTGGGTSNPYFGLTPTLPSIFPARTVAAPVNAAWVFENQNNKATNVQQWNLAFQRQVNRSLLFSATYIGNKTSHVWLGITQNPSEFLTSINGVQIANPTSQTSSPCTIPYNVGTAAAPNIQNLNYAVCNEHSGTTENDLNGYKVTNVNARKALNIANPLWGSEMQGGVTTASAWGDGAYNGLLISVQQRMAHNFSVLGNYTWAHCMDDGEIGQDITNAAVNPAAYKPSSWGNCGYGRKGTANITITAATPRLTDRLVNAIEYGWNGSAIFSVSTGSYYSVSAGYDTNLSGNTAYALQVANPKVGGTVSANPSCSAPAQVHNSAYWYNPCAFVEAPLGTFSTQVRNSYVGPANWNGLNLALWRSFTLPERVRLDFRAEAFNALNHPGWGNPGTTIAGSSSSNTFALNSGAGFQNSASNTYRIMQFAIKANF